MKAIVFLADGFEECEGLITVDILRRAGIETVMASVMGRLEVDSSRHIVVRADALAEDVDYESADLIVLPGGRIGTDKLIASELVRTKCLEFASCSCTGADADYTCTEADADYTCTGADAGESCTGADEGVRREKLVAAICAAPTVLADLGLLEGREATCHPDCVSAMKGAVLTGRSVAASGNIITGQALGATFDFAFELVRRLAGEETVRKVRSAICY